MVLSTAVMETAFADQFREVLKGETNISLRRIREDAFAAFTASGFPIVKNEDWKYTNVAPIAKGVWTAKGGVSPVISAEELELLKRFSVNRNGFAALNLAF